MAQRRFEPIGSGRRRNVGNVRENSDTFRLVIDRVTVVESCDQPMLPIIQVQSVYAVATLIVALIATLASTSCAHESLYFGKVKAPSSQRLVFQMSGEPDSLVSARAFTT